MRPDYYEGANWRILRLVPASARRLLDVGCGTGELGRRLKADRPEREVWGIEAVPAIAQRAAKYLDRVLVGDVERLLSLPCPDLFFDAITCGDVLEHLREPERVLRELRRSLAPEGVLICSVPNIGHWSVLLQLLRGTFSYQAKGLLDRTHLRFFTPHSLAALLQEAGYAVIQEDSLQVPDAHAVAVLGEAARSLGLDAEAARQNLSLYQQVYVARKAAPRRVCERSGLHEPASVAPCSVIVLTYNSMATLPTCLDSLWATLEPEDEVILVDNASMDGTAAYLQRLRRKDRRVRVICNRRNRGYAAGCNLGLRRARQEFLVLLNPDTVVRRGWLRRMQAHFREEDVGAVGPTSNFVAGQQFVGHHLPPGVERNLPPVELAARLARYNAGQSVETKLLIGFCLMLKRRVLEQVGLLDEDLFLGSDDLELSWRLRLQGYRLLVARDVYVQHVGGVSFQSVPSEETQRLLDESTQALARKLEAHYGPGNVPSSTELWGIDIFRPVAP